MVTAGPCLTDALAGARGDFCHPDGTIGRIVNARRRNGGGGWEAMIAWYNADGTAEPMSEGDEECTSDGTLRWHKEGQDLCVRNRFVPDP